MKRKIDKTGSKLLLKSKKAVEKTKKKSTISTRSTLKHGNISAFATYVNESKLIEKENKKECESFHVDVKLPFPSTETHEQDSSLSNERCANKDTLNDRDSKCDLNSETDVYEEEVDCQMMPKLQGDSTLNDGEDVRTTELTPSHSKTFEILPLGSDRSCVLLGITKHSKDVKVFGCGYIQLIKGSINILGHCLTPEHRKEKFYAPVTDCALLFEPVIMHSDKDEKDAEVDFNNIIMKTEINKKEQKSIIDFIQKFDVVLEMTSAWADTQSHDLPGYSEIYKIRQSDGDIVDELCHGTYIVKTEKYFKCFPCYEMTWNEISSDIEFLKNNENCQAPVILTAGGKNTGKSTFNRYLVNKLLQKFEKIYFMECDIGQPEFTPPGFISVTEVSTPILGPPFTHIKIPLYSVYHGDRNAGGEPDLYIECIKKVFSKIKQRNIPVVVNTMGWNRGLGLNLMIDTIHIVDPSYLVQINSQRESKNFPRLLREYVCNSDGWAFERDDKISQYKHLMMNVNIPISDVIIYKPSDLRDLRLLSYLDDLQKKCCERDGLPSKSGLKLSTLSQLRPYVVKSSDVLLCIAHETGLPSTHSLALFNSGIVGLCIIDEKNLQTHKSDKYLTKSHICQCIGLGIIRGVDSENGLLYIVGHQEIKLLKKVNCLTLGVLNIPECLYQEHGKNFKLQGDLPPYVSEDFPFQVTGSNKFRVYRSFSNKTP